MRDEWRDNGWMDGRSMYIYESDPITSIHHQEKVLSSKCSEKVMDADLASTGPCLSESLGRPFFDSS